MVITLKDVAEASKISIPIASLVLNDHFEVKINPETRKRVKEAALRLGYRPNIAARGLRLRKSGMVGVLVPFIATPFYDEIVSGIEIKVDEENYAFLFGCSKSQPIQEEMYLNLMRTHNIEGILMAALWNSNSEVIRKINNEIPFVFFDSFIKDIATDYVVTDNFKGAYNATKYLIKLGAKKICYVGDTTFSVLRTRFDGFLKALKEAGIKFSNQMLFGDDDMDLLKKSILKNKIDGIFIISNNNIMSILRMLKSINLQVPKDIRITGFDEPFFTGETQKDIEAVSIVKEPIPYIQQQRMDIGKTATEILFKKIKTGIKQHKIERVLIEPRFKM